MHHRAKDLTGLRVGYLTALAYHGSDGKRSLWRTLCDCGTEKLMAADDLQKQHKRGITASCGCMKNATIAEKRVTHGMSKHPAFAVWASMKARCLRPTHPAWHNYGGRGITVCPLWLGSFGAFWKDMGPTYSPGLELDRANNDAGYSPENCRWVTPKTQARNQRRNRRIGGKTLAEIAETAGIGYSTISYRVSAGVPADRLAEAPDVSRRFSTS